ncbi:MAG: hypothetical protein JF567_02545 [Xanthomonadales bacterium]|nr:hypothetical protein [Xanthomonadales bacterium]
MRQTACVALAASFIALAALPSRADTLLADRARQQIGTPHPNRGMTMAQVQQHFGAPQSKMDPRGGQKRDWPTINRWVYPQFTVYFEKSKVIDVVANKAGANEVGPRPPVR